MDRLSNLVTRLVPADAFNYSARVIQTLLQLGAHQVVALEEWITKRAVIGAAAGEVWSVSRAHWIRQEGL